MFLSAGKRPLEHSGLDLGARDDENHRGGSVSSGRTTSRQGLGDTHSAPSPSPAGRLGPPHCQLPPGCRLLADPSLGFKGATVHRCAFLDHSSELEKNGFLQSSVPSRPLESFHKKRGSEFGGSAGAHSDHSAPTRPWATLIKRGDAF